MKPETGWNGWKNSIKCKMGNYRNKMRWAGCQEVIVNAVKTSRSNPNNEPPHSNIKRPERAEDQHEGLLIATLLCGKTYCITSCCLVCVCVCTVTFLAPLELLIITLFLPIIYTFCMVNSITYLLYSNAHSYRSLVFIFHFLALCRVL